MVKPAAAIAAQGIGPGARVVPRNSYRIDQAADGAHLPPPVERNPSNGRKRLVRRSGAPDGLSKRSLQ